MSAVEVRETQIGLGVLARRRFRPSEEISLIDGKVIRDPAFSSDHCLDLQDGTSLDLDSPYRYLNHSCVPNCEIILWEFEDASVEVWLHTLLPISSGDELTIDYAWPSEAAIRCRCGSQMCRGWVVAESEVPHLACGG
jgi:SET domain-containing protein